MQFYWSLSCFNYSYVFIFAPLQSIGPQQWRYSGTCHEEEGNTYNNNITHGPHAGRWWFSFLFLPHAQIAFATDKRLISLFLSICWRWLWCPWQLLASPPLPPHCPLPWSRPFPRPLPSSKWIASRPSMASTLSASTWRSLQDISDPAKGRRDWSYLWVYPPPPPPALVVFADDVPGAASNPAE